MLTKVYKYIQDSYQEFQESLHWVVFSNHEFPPSYRTGI